MLMGSGKPSGALWLIILTVAALVLLCLLAALGLRNASPFTLPLSAGMPTPVPGSVVVQVVPTAVPPIDLVPTRDVGPQVNPQNPIDPQIQPTVPPQPPVIQGTPFNPNDYVDSVEPYPADEEPDYSTGNSGGSNGSSGSAVGCNRRVTHIVRRGENLFRIALRYNTTVASIARLNGIADVRSIRTGQRLLVVTCSGGGYGFNTYVVQPGDNLFRIALRFGTTVNAIRSANGLRSNIISVGQVLRIP
jgi:LysM repeat protein